jgi:CheY-like chemotaxis protein
VGLPEIDGLEVARRIRTNPQHQSIHLIALTGYGQPSDRTAAFEAGFDEHLVKPVDTEKLLGMLEAIRTSDAPQAAQDGAAQQAH